jgi:putative PIN family toxin of toxin-antitoxin system
MRVMVDANIVISAILFPKSIISGILKHIVLNNNLVLSQNIIDEIKEVFNRKFPHRINEMEIYLKKLPYKLFTLKNIHNDKYPNIRDIDDLPILANAIESNVDIFITGDKDFDDIKIIKPVIMKPNKYKEEYMV